MKWLLAILLCPILATSSFATSPDAFGLRSGMDFYEMCKYSEDMSDGTDSMTPLKLMAASECQGWLHGYLKGVSSTFVLRAVAESKDNEEAALKLNNPDWWGSFCFASEITRNESVHVNPVEVLLKQVKANPKLLALGQLYLVIGAFAQESNCTPPNFLRDLMR